MFSRDSSSYYSKTESNGVYIFLFKLFIVVLHVQVNMQAMVGWGRRSEDSFVKFYFYIGSSD